MTKNPQKYQKQLEKYKRLLDVKVELLEALLENEETYKEKYNMPDDFEDKILNEELDSTELENYIRYFYFKMETDIGIYDKLDEKLVNPGLFARKYDSEYPFSLPQFKR